MAETRKTILKEISLWKKRFDDSSKVFNGIYKDISRDAKKAYKEVRK